MSSPSNRVEQIIYQDLALRFTRSTDSDCPEALGVRPVSAAAAPLNNTVTAAHTEAQATVTATITLTDATGKVLFAGTRSQDRRLHQRLAGAGQQPGVWRRRDPRGAPAGRQHPPHRPRRPGKMTALKAHEVERFLKRPDLDAGILLVYGPDTGLVRETAQRLVRHYAGE